MDVIKNIIASNATEILVITPESPDYEVSAEAVFPVGLPGDHHSFPAGAAKDP